MQVGEKKLVGTTHWGQDNFGDPGTYNENPPNSNQLEENKESKRNNWTPPNHIYRFTAIKGFMLQEKYVKYAEKSTVPHHQVHIHQNTIGSCNTISHGVYSLLPQTKEITENHNEPEEK
jgi:hypothetical protein